ncbi:MAG: hypothetical protein K0S18_1906, partial [Anaerocolumna sp.]|nr:hypothetical protein [Anaerocolumna sp.]
MTLNEISGLGSAYENSTLETNQKSKAKEEALREQQGQKSTTSAGTNNNQAAVYEKSSEANKEKDKKIYKQDTATIAQLKADADRRSQQLRNLVRKMLLEQGEKLDDTDMYRLLREGKVPVDAATAAQAAEDINENGYWGINQTSERLVSFAKALSGGDPSKADEMIEAVKKGFEEATKAWGDDLPEISQKTLDATLQKLEDWKNS